MFSPSLRPSTNSLFAPAGGEHQGSRGSRDKHESPRRALEAADDNESGVVTASPSPLANGNGGGVGAGLSAIDAEAVPSSRDTALTAAPGGPVGGVSSSPPTARGVGAVSSPQDKDFVEEVRTYVRPLC